jgi:hypothetical protein
VSKLLRDTTSAVGCSQLDHDACVLVLWRNSHARARRFPQTPRVSRLLPPSAADVRLGVRFAVAAGTMEVCMKRFLGSCVLAATCAVGCSSSDPATEADYDDVAQALSSTVSTGNGGGDVGSMNDTATVAAGATGLGVTFDASGKVSGDHFGLDYSYELACSDAKGAAQTKCDSTTDSAKVDVNWSGNLSLPHITASVDREGSWTLAGVQSDTVAFDGSSDFTLDLSLQSLWRNASRSYHLTYSADYAGVKLDRSARKVTGGSVKYVIDAERMAESAKKESDAKFHMDAALTFGTDGTAMLTLDKSHSYKINTTDGSVDKQ